MASPTDTMGTATNDHEVPEILSAIYNDTSSLSILIDVSMDGAEKYKSNQDIQRSILQAMNEMLQHSNVISLLSDATTNVPRLINYLLQIQNSADMVQLVLQIIQRILIVQTSLKDIVAIFLTILGPVAHSAIRLELLKMMYHIIAKENLRPRYIFDMRGTHSGIILPPEITFESIKRGYSLQISFCLNPLSSSRAGNTDPSKTIIPIYNFRNAAGYGISGHIHSNNVLVCNVHSMTQRNAVTINLVSFLTPQRKEHVQSDSHVEGRSNLPAGAQSQDWISLTIVHIKSRMMLQQDKVRIFINKELAAYETLPFPNTSEMSIPSGQYSIGALNDQALQGQMSEIRLLSTPLSDAQVSDFDFKSAIEQKQVIFAYDARHCTELGTMCYDISGNNNNAWLQPGTIPVITQNMIESLASMGGVFSLVALLLKESFEGNGDKLSHYQDAEREEEASPSLSEKYTMEEWNISFELIAIMLERDPSQRSQFFSQNGPHICVFLLLQINSAFLTSQLLHTMTKIVNAFHSNNSQAKSSNHQFLSAVSILLFNVEVWSRASVQTQLELYGSILPHYYISILQHFSDEDYAKSSWRITVPLLCQKIKFYAEYHHHGNDEIDRIRIIQTIIQHLIIPVACVESHPGYVNGLKQIFQYAHDRCAAINSTLDKDASTVVNVPYDIIYLFQSFLRIFQAQQQRQDHHAQQLLQQPHGTHEGPPKILLRQKLKWIGGITLFWKPLQCKMLSVREQTLATILRFISNWTFADAFMVYSSLRSYEFSSNQCQMLIDFLQSSLTSSVSKERMVITFLGLLSCPTLLRNRFHGLRCIENLLFPFGQCNYQIAESVRSWCQWLSSLLHLTTSNIMHQSSSASTSGKKESPRDFFSVDKACQVLLDLSKLRITSKEDQMKAIESIQHYHSEIGADILRKKLSQLDSHVHEAGVKVLFEFPDLANQQVNDAAESVIVKMMIYILTCVKHGWIYVYELYFLIQQQQNNIAGQGASNSSSSFAQKKMSSILSRLLRHFTLSIPQLHAIPQSCIWFNIFQLCAISSLFPFFDQRGKPRPALESHEIEVITRCVSLWNILSQRLLHLEINWKQDGLSLQVNQQIHHPVCRRYFATAHQCQMISFYSIFKLLEESNAIKATTTVDEKAPVHHTTVALLDHLQTLLECYQLITTERTSTASYGNVAMPTNAMWFEEGKAEGLVHLWLIGSCLALLMHKPGIACFQPPEQELLFQLMTALATEAAMFLSPENPYLKTVVALTAVDTSLSSTAKQDYIKPFYQLLSQDFQPSFDHMIDHDILHTFFKDWTQVVDNEMIFNQELAQQDANARAAILNQQLEKTETQLEWMVERAQKPLPNRVDGNDLMALQQLSKKKFMMLDKEFQVLSKNRLSLTLTAAENGAVVAKSEARRAQSVVYLSSKETTLRMRLCMKSSVKSSLLCISPSLRLEQKPARESRTEDILPAVASFSPVTSTLLRSDSGSNDYNDLLTNERARAALAASGMTSKEGEKMEVVLALDDLETIVASDYDPFSLPPAHGQKLPDNSTQVESTEDSPDQRVKVRRSSSSFSEGNRDAIAGAFSTASSHNIANTPTASTSTETSTTANSSTDSTDKKDSQSSYTSSRHEQQGFLTLDILLQYYKCLYSCTAQLVRSMRIVSGTLMVLEDYLVFQSQELVDENGKILDTKGINVREHVTKQRIWPLSKLAGMYPRRYCLRNNAMEFFWKPSNKSYFFNFPNDAQMHGQRDSHAQDGRDLEKIHRSILKQKVSQLGGQLPLNTSSRSLRHPSKVFQDSQCTEKWLNYKITNFEYLMELNTIAGRTYHDLNQYPVFPWVLQDYTSAELDLSNPSTFRDLSKPIGALNPDRLANFVQRYETFDDPEIPPFMYGSHYSHMGAVLYYLLRLEPYTSYALRLADEKHQQQFDHADRLFHSIGETWKNCYRDVGDVKELIPEFFYCPAFLKNSNRLNFGTRQNGVQLDHVELPPWAHGSAEEFIGKNRLALESDYVSSHLHLWIDLIFGYKQRGKAAEEAHNVFFYLTYEGTVDVNAIEDKTMRESMQAQIALFGQTPTQLLSRESHPQRSLASTSFFNTNPLNSSSSVANKMIFFHSIHHRRIIHIEYRVTTSSLMLLDMDGKISIHDQNQIEALFRPSFSGISTFPGHHMSLSREDPIVAREEYQKRTTAANALSYTSESSTQRIFNPVSGFCIATLGTTKASVITNDQLIIGGHYTGAAQVFSLSQAISMRKRSVSGAADRGNLLYNSAFEQLSPQGTFQQHHDKISAIHLSGQILGLGTIQGELSIWTLSSTSSSSHHSTPLWTSSNRILSSLEKTLKDGLSNVNQKLGVLRSKHNVVTEDDFQARYVLNGHRAEISVIQIREELNFCISGSLDNIVLIHDLSNGTLIQNICPSPEPKLPQQSTSSIASLAVTNSGILVIESSGRLYSYHVNGTCQAQYVLPVSEELPGESAEAKKFRSARLSGMIVLPNSLQIMIVTTSEVQVLCVYSLQVIRQVVHKGQIHPHEISSCGYQHPYLVLGFTSGDFAIQYVDIHGVNNDGAHVAHG